MLHEAFPNSLIEEATNWETIINNLKKREYSLIILDLQIPGIDSTSLVKKILTIQPYAKILIFTSDNECVLGKYYYRIGVKGFLNKKAGVQSEILRAIQVILSGNKYISEELLKELSDEAINGTSVNPFISLSLRELEIAKYLNIGENMKGISKTLNLSASTIGTYRAKIYKKLNVNNFVDFKAIAEQYGL